MSGHGSGSPRMRFLKPILTRTVDVELVLPGVAKEVLAKGLHNGGFQRVVPLASIVFFRCSGFQRRGQAAKGHEGGFRATEGFLATRDLLGLRAVGPRICSPGTIPKSRKIHVSAISPRNLVHLGHESGYPFAVSVLPEPAA